MRGQAGSETRRSKRVQKVLSGVAAVFLTVCGHVHGLVVAGSVEIVAWLIIFEQTSTAARGAHIGPRKQSVASRLTYVTLSRCERDQDARSGDDRGAPISPRTRHGRDVDAEAEGL